MSGNTIEVQWLATTTGMLQAIDKINTRLDKQEKAVVKISESSVKGNNAAVGSYQRLEQELKKNEARLKQLAIGSAEWDKQKKKVDDLRKSVAGAKTELMKTGDGMNSMLSAGVSKVTQLAAGMIGFQQVVSSIVGELEHVKQLRLESAATTRTFEQALADVGQNIGAGAVPEARQMILEQAPQLGTTQEGLANLLGVAISAGAKDLKEAMSLSAAALKLTVGDAQKALALVGGTLDVASLGGSQNFEGALGQLLQTQAQVRSTNLSEFAANIGPGLAAATANGKNQQGVSTERALEMASVISQIIKDPTGSNTATTMRYLFTRMNAFVPKSKVELDDGGIARVSQKDIEAFDALKTFDERLQMMQRVPEIGQQFLETQRESIGKTAISEIINRSDRAIAFEEKAKKNIDAIDNAQQFFADLTNVLKPETATLTAERRSQANIQRAEVSGDRGSEGQAIKILEDTLSKVDLIGIDRLQRAAYATEVASRTSEGQSPESVALSILERVLTPGPAGVRIAGRVETESDRALVKEQIAAMKELIAAMKNGRPGVNLPQQQNKPREAPLPAATAP